MESPGTLNKSLGIIHISWANVYFACPHCAEPYNDNDDRYLNRINKNKCGYTTITCCRCNERFGMCYDYTSRAISFKI